MQIYNVKKWICYNVNFTMGRDGSLVMQIFTTGTDGSRPITMQTCRDKTDHIMGLFLHIFASEMLFADSYFVGTPA